MGDFFMPDPSNDPMLKGTPLNPYTREEQAALNAFWGRETEPVANKISEREREILAEKGRNNLQEILDRLSVTMEQLADVLWLCERMVELYEKYSGIYPFTYRHDPSESQGTYFVSKAVRTISPKTKDAEFDTAFRALTPRPNKI